MFDSENTENYPKGLFLIFNLFLIQTKVKLDRNKYYQYYLGTSDAH